MADAPEDDRNIPFCVRFVGGPCLREGGAGTDVLAALVFFCFASLSIWEFGPKRTIPVTLSQPGSLLRL